MESITLIGVDLAKHSFQVHGVDERGRAVLRKRFSRKGFAAWVSKLPQCVVAMESCSGSQYWGRVARSYGHEVRIVPSQFVKPFVKSQKNDSHDAEAIAIAASQPSMRFVGVKAVWQQELQWMHRIRQRWVHDRTALSNQLRSLLEEQGIVMARGEAALRSKLLAVWSDSSGSLSPWFHGVLQALWEEYGELSERIASYDRQLREVAQRNEACRRLQTVPGVGPKIATALLASMGDARLYKNGRQLAAWVGVVPKQASTGGRTRLLGITKRGDKHLRSLVIHGARSLVLSVQRSSGPPSDRFRRWVAKKLESKHINRVVVAVANKNLRIMWALLATGESYQPAKAAHV